MTPARAVFFGSPAFAVPSLRAVAADTTLVAVVSQPDRPAGRGQAPAPPAVKVAAAALGVPVLQPEKTSPARVAAALAALAADLFVVVAYGRILPQRAARSAAARRLERARLVAARLRGAAPIQWSIIRGDAETGVSIMRMEAGSNRAGGGDARAGDRGRRHGGDAVGQAGAAGRGVAGRNAAGHRGRRASRCAARSRGRDAGAAAEEGGRPTLPSIARARWCPAHARGVDPWPGATATLEGEPLKLFAPRVVARRRR